MVTGVANAVDTVPYGTCSTLTTTDSEGQTVYLYGYKVFSAYPNHNVLEAESWGVASRGSDASLARRDGSGILRILRA